jgi:ABC-2 type transport system ATP-binding protein
VNAIRVSNLVKKYGNVVAVDNLSLAVPEGAMFGFLGPNGSGKSTTIGCLTGLLDPTGGAIEILGQPFNANSAGMKRRVGVMPETLGLFEPLYAQARGLRRGGDSFARSALLGRAV